METLDLERGTFRGFGLVLMAAFTLEGLPEEKAVLETSV